MQMVKRLDADLGIAFDGDGDRLGVVTKSGESSSRTAC
jgi:phosphomannomutase/phosphoglucomutase